MNYKLIVTIHKIMYQHCTFSFDKETNIFKIIWDKHNKSFNNFMLEEIFPYEDEKYYDCSWVSELKKYINWEQGQQISLCISCERRKDNNNYYVSIFVINYMSPKQVYTIIDTDGYLRCLVLNKGLGEKLEKVNCLYNDNLYMENI
jgi:hypothetical protein